MLQNVSSFCLAVAWFIVDPPASHHNFKFWDMLFNIYYVLHSSMFRVWVGIWSVILRMLPEYQSKLYFAISEPRSPYQTNIYIWDPDGHICFVSRSSVYFSPENDILAIVMLEIQGASDLPRLKNSAWVPFHWRVQAGMWTHSWWSPSARRSFER